MRENIDRRKKREKKKQRGRKNSELRHQEAAGGSELTSVRVASGFPFLV